MEPADLQRILHELENSFGFTDDIEITIEANPDTVTREKLSALRAIGINRISFGMQSASPHVLALLDRTHNPDNVGKATHWAREVGFDHVSVDLIYGTPTETLDDWRESVNAALALPIDHLSAYALIVEEGTKFAAQVKRGEVASPDDDLMADKYVIVDDMCSAAGMSWYELSNWSKPNGECRHNIAYWQGADWWGLGPGAHSHFQGKRWWNVKHPSTYRDRILEKVSPALDSELLNESEKESERIMLQIRMPDGISKLSLSQPAQLRLAEYLPTGHIDSDAWARGAVCLTQSGRLIADRIVQEILL
jgi:oxygen-independent coproporphyrinogen-3 oxidase